MSIDPNKGIYVMAIACGLTGLHPQTLRKYERSKILLPNRKNGNRLYSENEVKLLQHITELEKKYRFNIQGIKLALAIEKRGIKIEKLM